MSLNIVDCSFATIPETTTTMTTVGLLASTHVALRVLEFMGTMDGSTSTAQRRPRSSLPSRVSFATSAPVNNLHGYHCCERKA